jgi:beta-lactamase regulating signal transducer with metallopeptidase domain
MKIVSSFALAYVLNAVWEVSLLVLAAEATTRMLRGIRATVTHRIWVGCLFLAIALPAVSFVKLSERGFGSINVASTNHTFLSATEPINKQTPGHFGYKSGSGFPWSVSASETLCFLYLASILFPVLKLARGLISMRDLLRTAEPALLGPDLQKAWKACLATFELTEVQVCSSTRLSSPATLTWRRPIVILPKDLRGAGMGEIVAAFCHELAHIRRRDFVLNLFCETIVTVLFFHPAVHWILRRLKESRELACDDIAARAMAGNSIYATSLLLLAQRMSPPDFRLASVLGVFDTEFLEKRVSNLIDKKPKQTRLYINASIVLGSILLLSICALCASLGLSPVLAQTTGISNHAPSGWFLSGSKRANYRTGVDKQMVHDGLPSAYLASAVQDTAGFGTLMQSIGATQYAGKRVRFRGWVRSKDVADWAGLWMRVDQGHEVVRLDNMQDRAIHGTRPWTMCDVVLDVPPGSTGISFGTLLSGSGEVWVSGVKFDVVGHDVPVTSKVAGARDLPNAPVNLGFQ